MTTARKTTPVRTTALAESLFEGRVISQGADGTVLEARPDGTCLVELVLAPQTADADGDFVQAVLTEGEYEVIRA